MKVARSVPYSLAKHTAAASPLLLSTSHSATPCNDNCVDREAVWITGVHDSRLAGLKFVYLLKGNSWVNESDILQFAFLCSLPSINSQIV